ncbi:MAG: glycosyltransferase family 4 protein [Coleofasciculus sp. S288]|nr:glycosyltransferase family 4 protein [Coleofasciculus sp. S288]
MKICIVTQNVIKGNGQGRVNYEIAWGAIRRGHHVTLLASSVAPELQQSNQVSWIFIPPVKGLPTQLLRDWVFAQRSSKWLREHRPELDLVIVNGSITWAAGDVDLVHFVHSAWLRSPVHVSRIRRDFYGAYQRLYTALQARWEKKVCHQAKAIVAVSEKVRNELVDIGIPKERIRVIVNGVDLQEFSPGDADRQKWGLPEGVPLALFAGDIKTPRKNLDTVLHALVQVPELHLVVVGSTEGSPYPQLAAKLDLEKRVHFLGFRHDVSEIMNAVDLFVFPSRYEACTLVLLEAMASSLPVITAITTGGAELVTPACGVVLPDSDDTEALAQALSRLASDRALRRQMGQAARSIAEQHSWASMAQSYVELFEHLSQQTLPLQSPLRCYAS